MCMKFYDIELQMQKQPDYQRIFLLFFFFFSAHIMLLYQSGRSQRSLVGRVKYPTDGVACPH